MIDTHGYIFRNTDDESNENEDGMPKSKNKRRKTNYDTPTYRWLRARYMENEIVKDIRKYKKKVPVEVPLLKKWVDFIHPLVANKPVTDLKRNHLSENYDTVALKDIAALLGRRENWVRDCYQVGNILENINLEKHDDLRKMLSGEKTDFRYGVSSFLTYLKTLKD